MSSADSQGAASAFPAGGAQREADAFLRAILECADYAIISTAPDGTIRTFNRAAERMLGYQAAEVVGKVTPAIIHDRDEVARRAAELTAELGRPVEPGFETFVAKARLGLADEQEWTYLRKDGSRFPVQLSVTAMHDAAGQIIGFMGIAHDITRRRTAQARVSQITAQLDRRVSERTAQLEASQERFRLVIEASPSGIIMVDHAGNLALVNAQVERMFGYDRSELLGRPVDLLVPARAQSAHAGHRAAFFAASAVRPMGAGRDLFARRKDGSEFPVEIGLNPIQTEAGTMVLGTIVDISARKEAERKLEEAARFPDENPHPVLRVGRDGRITYTNLASHSLLATWNCSVGEALPEPLAQVVAGALATGRRTTADVTCGGRVLTLNVAPIPAAGYVNLYGHDITERKRAEQVTLAFAELGRQLGAVRSRRAAAEALLATLDGLFAFDSMLLHLQAEDRHQVFRILLVDTVDGKRIEQPAGETALEPSAMFQRVVSQGAQLILRDAPGPLETPLEACGDPSRLSASLMFVPVRAGGRVIGVLSVQSYTPRAYDAEQLALLQSLADYAGTGLARVGAHAESERLSRLLLETQRVARLGCFEGDLFTGRDHWSDETYRQMGYAPGAVAASLANFLDRVHPEDRERVGGRAEQILRDGQPYESEYRLVTPDGAVRHIHSAVAAEVNATGRVVRVFGAAQDITHQKQIEAELRQSHAELERRVEERTAELARTNMLLFSEVEERKTIEAALRDSQARLRTIIDSTPDLIFIKDRQHRYTMVNEGYTRATGLRAEDIVGKNDLEIGFPAELVQGDPARGIRGYLADDREVMETGEMKIIPEEPGFMGGEAVFHSTVKVPLRDAAGNITGVLGYARDITERKLMEAELRHREEQLRDLFENATDLIQSVAPDGHLLFVNRAWLNTLGYRIADLATLTVFDIIHPDCVAECRAQFLRVMRGEPISGMQAIFRSVDGRKIHVEGSASCRFEDGKPVATRAIFRDITKRRAVEAEREQLIQKLQAALAEVRTLSGLLPVCGWCKKIRDDSGYWDSVEGYLKKNSGVDITHGICPECSAKMMGELDTVIGPPA